MVITYNCWTLPYKTNYNCLTWNYYSKYINLTNPPHINNNLTKLTGRPIITTHSWITSNPSCLLGIEQDRIILQLKNLFKEWNIPYPLIYNSYDLLLMLDKLHITNMYDLCLTTFDFTSLYTNIPYHDITRAIIMSCKLLNLPNFYGDYLLKLNKNKTLLLLVVAPISYQGSLWIVTIADKLWDLCSHSANFLFLTILTALLNSIFNLEKHWWSRFCWVMFTYKGRNFSRGKI